MKAPIEKAESGKLNAESSNKLEVRDQTREFERLPRESAKAYAAFKEYLDAGPQRSLEMVRRKVGKSKALMERWSRRYDWSGRVLAYGAYVAEVERQAIERVAVEKAVEWDKMLEPVRREAWCEAEKAIAMVREARERWEKSGRVPGFEGMARMLELAFKLKQFAAGVDGNFGEKGDTNVSVNVDVSLALEKIYGNAERGISAVAGQAGNAETIEIQTMEKEKGVAAATDELGTREDARPPGGAL